MQRSVGRKEIPQGTNTDIKTKRYLESKEVESGTSTSRETHGNKSVRLKRQSPERRKLLRLLGFKSNDVELSRESYYPYY